MSCTSRRNHDRPRSSICFCLNRIGNAIQIGNFRKVRPSRCDKLGPGKVVAATDPMTGEPLFEKPCGPRSKPKAIMIGQGMIFHGLWGSGVSKLVRAGVPEKAARRSCSTATLGCVPLLNAGKTTQPRVAVLRRPLKSVIVQ